MNLIDSHDTARAFSLLEGSKEKLMLAVALQLAYPGVPTIFARGRSGSRRHLRRE